MAILLMRHGPTALNGENKIRGMLNVSLSPEGQRIAQSLANKANVFPIVDLKSSDLRRAVQTATAVEGATGVPLTTHKELRPWDLGSLSGQNEKKALPVIEELVKHPDVKAPGGGESFNEFSQRVWKFVRDDVRDDQLHGIMAHGSGATTIEAAVRHGEDHMAAENEPSIKPGGMAIVTASKFDPIYRESEGDHGIAS